MICKNAVTAITFLLVATVATPIALGETSNQPPINASGAGMTSAQLDATRPVLSAIKSIGELQQAVDQIKDSSKQIVDLCTKETPIKGVSGDFDGNVTEVEGPYSHTEGKYYKAAKWKLVQVKAEIDKQRSFLAAYIISNQQDHRTLRASDACREKFEALRGEARTLMGPMTTDANQMETLIASGADQAQITASAKSLIKSTEAVERKLKEMDKVLKKEIKD